MKLSYFHSFSSRDWLWVQSSGDGQFGTEGVSF
jgi:hypothetical protein